MNLDRIQDANVRLTRGIALIGLIGLLIVATATLVDVLSRWLLNAPIAGVYDLSTLFISVTMAACFPAALASRQNIQVTFLAELLPAKVEQVLDVVAGIVTLAFFALLAWQLAVYCGELLESGETSFILEVPIAPWWIVVTALFFLCIPVQILVVFVDVARLFRHSPAVKKGAA
ncbi:MULTISPECIES: TRAP transporter small permease [Microbaculum]|uniref:TRAP transporter small permease protein n=1 Tax=Microbaculum marinisediminis TaxID=2931392 RepID=A0AAW5R3I2_9HYPH|nr:TRAP transporter small permease [Microbaculum sp. A6E488]MCT8973972.1 TRAP transporter small permease [Microbaculum sp. A6E488]